MSSRMIPWAAMVLCFGSALTGAAAADVAAAPSPLRVLLIGNSQCPAIVRHRLLENLAASDRGGRPIEVGGCIRGGASLRSHWDAGTGPDTARGMIAGGPWDYVVLQDIYHVEEAGFQPSARRFHALIREVGAKTVLFGTASILDDYPAGFQRQHRLYLAMGRELGVPIVDASPAYVRYFGDHPSAERLESLFAEDRRHPGLWGSYLYACLMYGVLTERSPVGLAAPAEIPADVARSLQEIAWAQRSETAAAARAGEPLQVRLHDAATVLLDHPSGAAFEIQLDVRDLNAAPRGPAELLFKVYGPDGRLLVREIVPDDGVTQGLFVGPAAGYDHMALRFAAERAAGLAPAIAAGRLCDPARLAALPARRFRHTIPAGPGGVYRVLLVGQPDLVVTLTTDPALPCGVAGSPDHLCPLAGFPDRGWVWLPEGTTGMELAIVSIDGEAGRTVRVLDQAGTELGRVDDVGGYATHRVEFGAPAPPAPGRVVQVELGRRGGDGLYRLMLLVPKGNRYGKPGGRVPAVVCPDRRTAEAVRNGVIEHDGRQFQQHCCIPLHDYLRSLGPDDFTSPAGLAKNPAEFIPLGSHEKPPPTSADRELFEYLHTKDRATLNRAVKDMLEGMGQLGFNDEVMRGRNLAYEMGCYSYFYPRPALRMLRAADLPAEVRRALEDFTLRVGDRLAFCRGLELTTGNAAASLVAQLRYCAEAAGDERLRGLFDTYFERFTSGGFGGRVGAGPSGALQEGFGYDQHYGTYVLRGWRAVIADFGDERFTQATRRVKDFYSFTFNQELPGGAWSSRTSAQVAGGTYDAWGDVPWKGLPGPSLTENLAGAGEIFGVRRPAYYCQTYHGRIAPAYLAVVGAGQVGFSGGMIGQLHVPGRGPVMVSRLNGDYGAGMHPTAWRTFMLHSVVGTTADGLPMVGADSEHVATLTDGVLTTAGDTRAGSVRVSREYRFDDDRIHCTVALAPRRSDVPFALWSRRGSGRGVVQEAYEMLPLLAFKPGSRPAKRGRPPDPASDLELRGFGGDGADAGVVTAAEPRVVRGVLLDRGGYGVRVTFDRDREAVRGRDGTLLVRLADPGTPAEEVRMEYDLAPFGAAVPEPRAVP